MACSSWTNVVRTSQSGGWSPPNSIAEALAQELLGVAGARVLRAGIGPNPQPRVLRRLFLAGVDETLIAHARQHDVAAGNGAVEIGPGRQAGGRLREPRDERALGQGQLLRRLAEQVPRHRLDAVDAGAQIDPIEIQLEDLRLRELRVDHDREHGLARLAPVGPLVRQEQRPRQLLRQRAPALDGLRRADVANDGAAEGNRVDAGMVVEAVVLDGDERLLQVQRDVGERHVLVVLVHAEPAPAVGRQEPGVADAARQPMDGIALAEHPGHRDRGEDDQRHEDHREHPVAHPPRPQRYRHPQAWRRRPCRIRDNTV